MEDSIGAFEELKLVIDEKHHVNNLLVQTMMVFYATIGALFGAAFALKLNLSSFLIGIFSSVLLTLFLFIVCRLESTNDKCDERASQLEAKLGIKVISNYQIVKTEKIWKRIRLHTAIEVATIIFLSISIAIVVIFNPIHPVVNP